MSEAMKTLTQAVAQARELQAVDGGRYAVVRSTGFIGQGPYFCVHVEQVPVLVDEGAVLVWETIPEKVMA